MTPGNYLRKRREAAGLSLADAALLYAFSAAGRDAAQVMLAQIEVDQFAPADATLQKLRTIYAFDDHIYGSLVEGLPLPVLCRVCACSWADPCIDSPAGPCAWAPGENDLCTACIGKEATRSTSGGVSAGDMK